jgi:hypothetical protein
VKESAFQSVLFVTSKNLTAGYSGKSGKRTAVPRSRSIPRLIIQRNVNDIVTAAGWANIGASSAIKTALTKFFPQGVINFSFCDRPDGFTHIGANVPEFAQCVLLYSFELFYFSV